ncbi:MAG: hypothetical protein QOD86_380 [Miltoncostaeaceae bacterium]|jgi:hypothetical protein|nr:hypothetical protein [Miltoncostaeaceae bacterium]
MEMKPAARRFEPGARHGGDRVPPAGERRTRSVAIPGAVVVAALVAWVGSADPRAEASCIQSVTYLGAPFYGVGRTGAADVGARVGVGTIPACNDVVYPPGTPKPPEEQPASVTVHRVRGVAPRLGVALPEANGRAGLMVLAEGPCPLGPVERALACLRRETRRLVQGPSLIAPPSAQAGQVILLTVRIRDRRLRRSAVHGLDSYFQRRVDGRWRSLFQMQHPIDDSADPPDPGPVDVVVRTLGLPAGRAFAVRLPVVAAGQYRIAKSVMVGGRERWLYAPITVQRVGQGLMLTARGV